MLRGWFGGGGDGDREGEENGAGAETVERLVDRLQTSTALEDRRDALKALRALARKFRLEVGSMGMGALLEVVGEERQHPELLAMALDTLASVMAESDDADVTDATDEDALDQLSERFTEIFIKDRRNVLTVVSALQDYDFGVRRPAIQLLTNLLRHRAAEVQETLMHDPMSIPRLLDLLHESREVLRNEAVLMMSELTRGSPEIQKLVAYENAFQLLFDVIDHEAPDSIVIEDCLFATLNLLRKNQSNQQLFREASLVQRLHMLLKRLLDPTVDEDDDENGPHSNGLSHRQVDWTKQRAANIIFTFHVIRCLVAPDNSSACIAASQKIAMTCGMLTDLCTILLTECGATAEILTEAIIAVAEVIRANQKNQDHFASLTVAYDTGTQLGGPRKKSAVIVLLLSMVAEKQPFKLRCAVLYCFQCYLYRNEAAKTHCRFPAACTQEGVIYSTLDAEVIETLLPASAESGDSLTAGHLLCTALIGHDPVQVWFGCVALSHCLSDSTHLKEQLLRVQLATGVGEPPVALMDKLCCQLIGLGNRRPQTRSGLLMLLAVWMHDCPVAVSHFLHKDENVHYLTSNIGEGSGEGTEGENQVIKGLCALLLTLCLQYNDDSVEKCSRKALMPLIERRVGKDLVVERLEGVSRSEQYVRAAQRPQPHAKTPTDLLLDHEFTKLFKALETDLIRTVQPHGGSTTSTAAQHEAIIGSYKELIKRQDEQITSLNSMLKRLQADLANETTAAQKLRSQLECAPSSTEVDRLRLELADKCHAIERLQQQQPNSTTTTAESADGAGAIASAKAEAEQMSAVAKQWQAEAQRFQQFAEQWQQYQVAQLPDPNDAVCSTLRTHLQQLEQQMAVGWQAFEQQGQQLAIIVGEKEKFATQLQEMENKMQESERKLEDAKLEVERQKLAALQLAENASKSSSSTPQQQSNKEQEDLLLLLADQDTKLREYRRRLAAKGETVTEDEEEEEEEEDDKDDDDKDDDGEQEQARQEESEHEHPSVPYTSANLFNGGLREEEIPDVPLAPVVLTEQHPAPPPPVPTDQGQLAESAENFEQKRHDAISSMLKFQRQMHQEGRHEGVVGEEDVSLGEDDQHRTEGRMNGEESDQQQEQPHHFDPSGGHEGGGLHEKNQEPHSPLHQLEGEHRQQVHMHNHQDHYHIPPATTTTNTVPPFPGEQRKEVAPPLKMSAETPAVVADPTPVQSVAPLPHESKPASGVPADDQQSQAEAYSSYQQQQDQLNYQQQMYYYHLQLQQQYQQQQQQQQQPPMVPNQQHHQQQPMVPNQHQQQPPIVPNQHQQPPMVPNQHQQPPMVPNQQQQRQTPMVPNQQQQQQPPMVPNQQQQQQPPMVPNQQQQQPTMVPNQQQCGYSAPTFYQPQPANISY